MSNLEIRTLLSVFATALTFGCSPQVLPEDDDVSDLPDEEVPALGDDDDATDEQADDDDATEEAADDDDATPVDDDDATEDAADDDDVPAVSCSDAYEENDTAELAASLGFGDYAGLTMCQGDDDYYAIAALAGDRLILDLSFVDEQGDIDVQLQDAAGAWVASGTTANDDEHLEADIEVDGLYFARVYRFGTDGEPIQDYSLSVDAGEIPEPVACPLDPWEDNDDEAAAASVSAGAYTAASICMDDPDWYAVDATEGQLLTVDLLFIDEEGDVDLRVVAPDGTYTSSVSVSDDESLTVESTVAGTYLVRATLFADPGLEHGNTYDLNVSLQ